MRRLIGGAVLFLAMAPALLGAPPEVPAKIEAKPGKPVLFDVKVSAGAKLGWAVGFDKSKCPIVRLHSDDPLVLSFMAIPDAGGDFYVTFWTVGEAGYSQTVITVGGAPVPVPIDPKPVDPVPDAAPIPGAGLRVMLVYDPKALSLLTEEQKGVLFATEVRDYLRATCPKGADGVTAECRFWPIDTDPSGESKLWKDAFAKAKAKRGDAPIWVIVSNGKTGFEGKAPETVQGMLDLLKKYGGK